MELGTSVPTDIRMMYTTSGSGLGSTWQGRLQISAISQKHFLKYPDKEVWSDIDIRRPCIIIGNKNTVNLKTNYVSRGGSNPPVPTNNIPYKYQSSCPFVVGIPEAAESSLGEFHTSDSSG